MAYRNTETQSMAGVKETQVKAWWAVTSRLKKQKMTSAEKNVDREDLCALLVEM
jgi:hypothetical protein